MGDHFLRGTLGESALHLCLDMQRLFSQDGPWPTPWMERVLPVAAALAERHPERTVFTRFIPQEHPQQMPGMWQWYYALARGHAAEFGPATSGFDAAAENTLPARHDHR